MNKGEQVRCRGARSRRDPETEGKCKEVMGFGGSLEAFGGW